MPSMQKHTAFFLLSLFSLTPGLFAGGTTQQQAYVKASNTEIADRFGSSMDMSGDTLVIGATGEDSGVVGNPSDNSQTGAGAVYVFVRNGNTWTQQAYLKASNAQAGDFFGQSVAVDGDTLVVGAMWEAGGSSGVDGNELDNSMSQAGAAYVFVRRGTAWTQQAYLKASNPTALDNFGYDVGISGDTIVVGAVGEDSAATGVGGDELDNSETQSGAAYVFVRSGTTWTQQAYVKASNTQSGQRFGGCVAIFADTLVVGAKDEDSNSTGVGGEESNVMAPGSGAAYVFVRGGTAWSQQAYLKASNTDSNDQFGTDAAIYGDTIVVGAPLEDSDATGIHGDQANDADESSGAAYVFLRNGATWSQQAYLKPSNTDAWDDFAHSVDVSGDTIVIGARGEDSAAVGVGGDQGNNTANSAGAAYVYWRSGVAWSHQAYLKASNTGADDSFGEQVAISGGSIAVGAPLEDSDATGIDGAQFDESASFAGAAYVFTFDAPAYSTFCFGDGSLATPCPCTAPNTVPSPPADTGHGCANSFNSGGALLWGSGTLSPDTLKVTAHVAPVYIAFALLVKGNGLDTNGVASSDGIRCVDGAILRFGGHNAGTNGDPQGQWSYPNSVQTNPISAATLQTPGQTAYYQLFYRNAAPSFCTAATANWSSGIVVPWP